MDEPTGSLPRPPGLAPDNAAAIAHLNMLQTVITRLAGDSAQCKTWCLAIVSALVSFSGALKSDAILATAVVPIVIFGLLDATYLSQEKAYRRLFDGYSEKLRTGQYRAAEDAYRLSAPPDEKQFVAALTSWSVWPTYVGLVIVYALARMSGWLV